MLIVVHPVGGITLSQPVHVAICMVVIAKKSTYYNQNQIFPCLTQYHNYVASTTKGAACSM